MEKCSHCQSLSQNTNFKSTCEHILCSNCISRSLIESEFDKYLTSEKIKIRCFCKKGYLETQKNSLLSLISSKESQKANQNESICSEHNKKIEFFCQVCNKEMCPDCSEVDSDHAISHIPIEKVIEENIKKLSNSMRINNYDDMKKLLDEKEQEYKKELENNFINLKNKITQLIEFLNSKLNEINKKNENNIKEIENFFQILKTSYSNYYNFIKNENISLKELLSLNEMNRELKSILIVDNGHKDIDDLIKNIPNMFPSELVSLKLVFSDKINKSEVISSIDTEHFEFMTTLIKTKNNQLITSGTDKKIKLFNFDPENKEYILEKEVITNLTKSVKSLLLLKNGKIIAGCTDGTIKIFQDNYEEYGEMVGHSKSVRKILQYTDDIIISCSEDSTIKFWKYKMFECIKTLTGHNGIIYDAFLTKNDQLFSCGDDMSIKIWNLNEDEPCNDLKDAHEKGIYCLCKLDGGQFASGGKDGFVNIWKDFHCENKLMAHGDWVTFLLKINENTLLSGGKDNLIKIWNMENWECMKILNAHTNTILKAYFFKENKILVSGGCDSKIIVWKFGEEIK